MHRNKKVIYIMGAGRSGTTLLDIILGNAKDAFSAGEIIKFPKLKAIPHGFGPETENYKFWMKVKDTFFQKVNFNFDHLVLVCKHFESHHRFLLNYFHFYDKSLSEIYIRYINSFFDSIFENIEGNVIIDSSKYPGRALALANYLKYELYVIYLIRDPRGVIRSFSKKNIEQPPKKFINANIYYFVINLFCNMVKKRIDKRCFMKIKYEDFIKNPIKQLSNIQNRFNVDLSIPIEKIKHKLPFKVGFLFEGNRIRLQKSITLRADYIKFDSTFKNLVTYVLNGIWY